MNKFRGKFIRTQNPILQIGINANILKYDLHKVVEIFAKQFTEISINTAKENKRGYKQSREELERMERELQRIKHDVVKHLDNQNMKSAFRRADMQLAIFQGKDSAGGLDMITNLMISHLIEE